MVFACALALVAAGATAEEAAFAPSEALQALLSASGENGEALVGSEARAYFEGLPAQAQELFDRAAGEGLLADPSQLNEILGLGLPAGRVELLLRDNCALCHTDPGAQDPETLFTRDPEANGSPAHLNLAEVVNDVHFRRGLSCAGCHGGDPGDDMMADEIYERWPAAPARHEDRTWIPDFCARCHADPGFMRRFNPGLPTDQYAKYRESRHGMRLFEKQDSKVAQCVSCHGVHGIRGSKSPRSLVHPQKVPYTCGACHGDAEYMRGYETADGKPLPTNQLEEYESSVHGRALLVRGDLGAPACNDCHGNHAAVPPDVSSVAEVCRTCHAGNGELFDGSKHKTVFEKNGWPECATCHGNHAVVEADDTMLSEESSPLCYACHRKYAEDNPECIRTARYFHASITGVADESHELAELVHVLAEKGLDADPLASTVAEMQDYLRLMRSRIHTFEKSEFQEVEAPALAAVEKARKLIADADAEYRFRRNGLFVSLAFMLLLALAIYMKIRQVDSNG
ncbi:MAG TPA: cytochrome c3 family protein [Myxococcota bacterium]